MGSETHGASAESVVGTRAVQAPVIVGIDGSEVAVRAAYWAAVEADARRVPLQLVHVATHDEISLAGLDLVLAARQAVTERWVRTCERPAPAIEPLVLAGDPAARLTELSEAATLLVLGDRRPGPLAGLLCGSVAAMLAGASRCPIALIRPLRNAASAVGPVLVAVEHTGSRAVAAAFRAAATRHSSLVVADMRRRAVAEGDLDAVVAGLQRQFPAVSVQCVAVAGDRHAALERLSVTAQLLVIGRDGDRKLRTHLNPMLHLALHHTQCPVLVLPEDSPAADGAGHLRNDRPTALPAFG
ncbi:universal stress protein [Nocardia bhagyanarayanae]|uniref:Nucleotide-binding universal stress UspA family protein n=1 Tax=Nocardia bhagyanarayanae TaxID=1215925 RepID=A0A543FFG3_9NOCA|nr:universal stress protein [Nocardia bhagyanarayanae]TQM32511.1 nucleotide-binding universal stress UspA family protein [Nocardia bhagyanarayanae]